MNTSSVFGELLKPVLPISSTLFALSNYSSVSRVIDRVKSLILADQKSCFRVREI
jgi:hypothetical protein